MACSYFSVTSKYFIFCCPKKDAYPWFILLSDITEKCWVKMRQKGELVVMNGQLFFVIIIFVI